MYLHVLCSPLECELLEGRALAYFIHVCNSNTYQVVWHKVDTQYLFMEQMNVL